MPGGLATAGARSVAGTVRASGVSALTLALQITGLWMVCPSALGELYRMKATSLLQIVEQRSLGQLALDENRLTIANPI